MTIVFTPACVSGTTDSNGYVLVRMRVPGTYGGLTFDLNNPNGGRFLKKALIWLDSGNHGDRVYGFRLEDDERVVPENIRAAFPDYPIITKFQDDPPSPALGGSFLRPGEMVSFGPINDDATFVAAGLSIVGELQAGAGGAGQVVRANFFWGKWV